MCINYFCRVEQAAEFSRGNVIVKAITIMGTSGIWALCCGVLILHLILSKISLKTKSCEEINLELITGAHSMEMSSTIYAKGRLKDVLDNGHILKEGIKSRIECAGVCLTREDCHFYSWEKDVKECDMDFVDKGWHFNYTENNEGHRNIYMDTGTL